MAAAFGRLCVETIELDLMDEYGMAAAFGRLCVETIWICVCCLVLHQPPSGGCVLKLAIKNIKSARRWQPPSGGCVLKPQWANEAVAAVASRLRAAVC